MRLGGCVVSDVGSSRAFRLHTPSDKAAAAGIFRSVAALAWSSVRPGGLFAVGDSGTLAAFDLTVDPSGPIVRENSADAVRSVFQGGGREGRKHSDAPRAVGLAVNGGGPRPAGRLYLAVVFASAKGLRGSVGAAGIDASPGSISAVAVHELAGGWALRDVDEAGREGAVGDGLRELRVALGAD